MSAQNQIIKLQDILNTKDQYLAIKVLTAGVDETGQPLTNELKIQLSYIRMNSLSATQLASLMKQSLLLAYEIEGFDLAEQFEEYLAQYNFIPDEVELCKQVKNIISTNNEPVGGKEIVVSSKKGAPVISSWLSDYLSFASSKGLGSDALGLVKYFNDGENVKNLDPYQKFILQSIFKLYNFCDRNVLMWEMLPEVVDPKDVPEQISELDINMAFSGIDEEDVTSVAEGPLPPIVPQKQERTVSDFKIPLAKDLDLKAQPRRGLVFDQGTNVDIDETIQKKQEEEIQAKLEDLKQRKKK